MCDTDSSRLDHDYGMGSLWQDIGPMDQLDSTLGVDYMEGLAEFGLDMPELGESLGSVNVMTSFDEEYASAPTPYMANQTVNEDSLDGIDTDDLISPNEVEVEAETESFHLSYTGEAEVANDAPPAPEANQTRAPREKKRKIEAVYDDDSDADSVVTVSTKGKPGRKQSRSAKCMSRNAVAARENREKKKAYIDGLERQLKETREANKKLMARVNTLQQENGELVTERDYFKGVLANDSSISILIRQLASTNQIQLVGTHFEAKPSATTEAAKPLRKSHRIATTKGDTSPAIAGPTSGICLHIHNKKVSLEVCAKCSQKQSHKATK